MNTGTALLILALAVGGFYAWVYYQESHLFEGISGLPMKQPDWNFRSQAQSNWDFE